MNGAQKYNPVRAWQLKSGETLEAVILHRITVFGKGFDARQSL